MLSICHWSAPSCYRPSLWITTPASIHINRCVSVWAVRSGALHLSQRFKWRSCVCQRKSKAESLMGKSYFLNEKIHPLNSFLMPKKMSVPINMGPWNMLTRKWVGAQLFCEWQTVFLTEQRQGKQHKQLNTTRIICHPIQVSESQQAARKDHIRWKVHCPRRLLRNCPNTHTHFFCALSIYTRTHATVLIDVRWGFGKSFSFHPACEACGPCFERRAWSQTDISTKTSNVSEQESR